MLASIPVLFLLVWVAGQFGFEQTAPGSRVTISIPDVHQPPTEIAWNPSDHAVETREGWIVVWPASGKSVKMSQSTHILLQLPTSEPIPIIHKKRWWNTLVANPIGYLPNDAPIDAIEIGLTPQVFLPFGPGWIRGWMFTFFLSFLLSSIAFKLLLKID